MSEWGVGGSISSCYMLVGRLHCIELRCVGGEVRSSGLWVVDCGLWRCMLFSDIVIVEIEEKKKIFRNASR